MRQRLADDRHARIPVFVAEVAGLEYERSYQTFRRRIRDRQLCPIVSGALLQTDGTCGHSGSVWKEIQWDCLELKDAAWGKMALVPVGARSYARRFRPVFCRTGVLSSSARVRIRFTESTLPTAPGRQRCIPHRRAARGRCRRYRCIRQ